VGTNTFFFNPDFNYTEFGTIKNMAGSNNFVLSTKQWILSTNHLLLIHEYQRLKAAEQAQLGWSVRRERDGVAHAGANGGTVQCSETSDYKTHQKHHRIL
jgi:hypothetical protein